MMTTARRSGKDIYILKVISVVESRSFVIISQSCVSDSPSRSSGLLRQSRVHGHHHVVRDVPHEYAPVSRRRYEPTAIVREAQARHQLRVAQHRRHALARIVVVHTQRFIRA